MTSEKIKLSENNYLNISFATSKWEYIKEIREFLSGCLRLNSLKNEVISKIIVASSEMLENAIKYNLSGNIETYLNKNLDKNEIEYIVCNRASEDDAINAIKAIDEINNADDAFLYYINKLRDRKTKTLHGGGLGLARVSAEAKASLSVNYYKDDSKLIIKAKIKF
jgi:hypothetical protein